MIKSVLARVQAFLIGSILLAVATGIALVAAAYGVYAVLRVALSAAASAGTTAVVFALVALVAAVLLRQTFSSGAAGKAAQKKRSQGHAPDTVRVGLEAGTAVMSALSEMLAAQRENRRKTTKSRRGR